MSLCHARVTLAGNMKQDRCGNWTSERWQDLSEITHLERVGVTFARNIPFVLRQGSKTLSSGPQVKAELWPRGSEGEALAALVVVVDSCPEDTPSFKITILGSQLVARHPGGPGAFKQPAKGCFNFTSLQHQVQNGEGSQPPRWRLSETFLFSSGVYFHHHLHFKQRQ